MKITIFKGLPTGRFGVIVNPGVRAGRHMASKSEVYRERAADFENKARLTSDASGKSFYFEVAHVYLQLAEYLERAFAKNRDVEK